MYVIISDSQRYLIGLRTVFFQISKMAIIQHRDLQQKLIPLNLGQSSTWTSWIAAITKKHKNGFHDSIIQHRDFQQKLNTIKFWSIFDGNILSAILYSSPYQNSPKWFVWFNYSKQKFAPKLNTIKSGSVFYLDILLAILDSSHYQNSQKWLP